jgi:hypothetical protein
VALVAWLFGESLSRRGLGGAVPRALWATATGGAPSHP